jgi:uncharacterized protein (TIGR00369 family)
MNDDSAVRSRLVSWSSADALAARAREMGGLEFMQAMLRGDVPHPPIAELMGFRIASVEEGRMSIAVVPGEEHYNPNGVVHGGFVATLLDTAVSCAAYSTLPLGVGCTTVNLNVHFVRATTIATGALRCDGAVLHRGRRMLTSEAKLVDDAGKLYAHATATILVLRD